jgi:hypothetical protein
MWARPLTFSVGRWTQAAERDKDANWSRKELVTHFPELTNLTAVPPAAKGMKPLDGSCRCGLGEPTKTSSSSWASVHLRNRTSSQFPPTRNAPLLPATGPGGGSQARTEQTRDLTI